MAAVTQPDIILDALVTRLGDISTARTYKGGGAYRTTPAQVARGLKLPTQVDAAKRPALFVDMIGSIRKRQLGGGWYFGTMPVVVHGYVKSYGDDYTQQRRDVFNLRADIEAAVMEDPQLGSTCVECRVMSDDGAERRPQDSRTDGFVLVELEIIYYGSRTQQ